MSTGITQESTRISKLNSAVKKEKGDYLVVLLMLLDTLRSETYEL